MGEKLLAVVYGYGRRRGFPGYSPFELMYGRSPGMSDADPETLIMDSNEANRVLETVATAAWRTTQIETILSSKDVTIKNNDVDESVLVAHGRVIHGIGKW